MDKRHQRRILFLQALYANEFPPQSWEVEDFDFGEKTLTKVEAIKPYLEEFDAQIQAVAPERPIKDISKIDLSILRLILFEHQTKNTPVKVLIDEGVELAKEFGNDNAFAFVNAVLEKLLITNNPNLKDDEDKDNEDIEKKSKERAPSLENANSKSKLDKTTSDSQNEGELKLNSPAPTPSLEAPSTEPQLPAPEAIEVLAKPIPSPQLPPQQPTLKIETAQN